MVQSWDRDGKEMKHWPKIDEASWQILLDFCTNIF